MKPITADMLVRAIGCARSDAAAFAAPLTEACEKYDITTPARLAAFLAQVGHESGSLGRLVENLNYGAAGLLATWPTRFTKAQADALARKPEAIANHVYGGRLGNTKPGDGWKYRGRGPIQNTGAANYEAVRDLIRERFPDAPDFVADPDQLATPRWGAIAAGAYWSDHNLNALADVGAFDKITTRINGGQNGRADRRARYERARKALA